MCVCADIESKHTLRNSVMSVNRILQYNTKLNVCLTAGLDYIAVNRILDFPPGTTQNTLTIRVLDDLGQPSLEGPEAFIVVLRLPHGAALGEPHSVVVTVDDSVSDSKYYDIYTEQLALFSYMS